MSAGERVCAVDSIEDECRLMGQCSCGGDWKLTSNEVTLRGQVWIDYIGVRCGLCDAHTAFGFDVSSFFEARPGVWRRTPSARRGRVFSIVTVTTASSVSQVGAAA